jgi:hypothetical protein
MTVTISSLREKRHSLSPRIRSHSLSSLFTHRKEAATPSEKPVLRPLYTRVDTCDRLEVHHPSPTDVEFERKGVRIQNMSSPLSSPTMDSPPRGRQRGREQLSDRAAGPQYSPTPNRQRERMHEQLWDGTLERGMCTTSGREKVREQLWDRTSVVHQSPTTSPLDRHTQTRWPRFTGPDGRIYQVVPEEEKPRGRMPGRGYATVGPRDMPSRGTGVRFMGNDGRVYHVVPEEKRRTRGEMPGMWVE